MPVATNPQQNLPLEWSIPKVSLPEQTQVEAIAALSELISQLWERDRPMDKPLEDKTDE